MLNYEDILVEIRQIRRVLGNVPDPVFFGIILGDVAPGHIFPDTGGDFTEEEPDADGDSTKLAQITNSNF